MKIKLLSLAIASLVSVNALAVSIDYRHEMTDNAKVGHKDRLLISHRFANGFGLSSEVKWAQSGRDNNPNKPFHEQVSNGTEVVASYVYKINDMFSIEPGLSLESDSNANNYRPYLRGKVNITEDLSASLRYRPYFKRMSGNINVVTNGVAKDTSESGYNLTANIAYNFLKDYSVEYELDYKHSTKAGSEYFQSDKENYKFEHDVKLAYKIDKNWKPYMAIGNVSGNKNTDERQTRYRVGLQYSF